MTRLYKRTLLSEIKNYLNSPQAIIITGIRRAGKTSLLRYIFDSISSENKLFLDLENPLTRRLFEEENYEMIKTNLETSGLNFHKPAYVFLDEIQWFKQIPSIVKYLIDHYKIKFFLTGSASFYLKNLFSESLAGRKFIFELFPLSFREFLDFKQAHIVLPTENEHVSEVVWKMVEPHWQEYLTFGGFPEIVLAQNPKEKEALLGDIFTSYFQKEVEQLADFRKTDLIRNLIIILAASVGNLLNIERIASELKVSRLTVEEWIYFLKATYLIDLIAPYSQSERIAIRKAKKIYFVDWSLASNIAQISQGQRFENCIFNLLRLKGNLTYFRKKSGTEIDFILDKKTAFEVKVKPTQFDALRLKKMSNQIEIQESFIVAEKYSPHKSVIPGFTLS